MRWAWRTLLALAVLVAWARPAAAQTLAHVLHSSHTVAATGTGKHS